MRYVFTIVAFFMLNVCCLGQKTINTDFIGLTPVEATKVKVDTSIKIHRIGPCSPSIKMQEPLLVVDGKKMQFDKLRLIDPNTIESVKVVKDKEARRLYGRKGKNGVIIISLKQSTTPIS